jgi:capsid protein
MLSRVVQAAVVAALASAMLAGCANYYRVTDPASGRDYYTRDIDKTGDGGVKFQDARTGDDVTLQSSEITEVAEGDYRRGITTP